MELLDMLQQSENVLIQKDADANRALNNDNESRNIIKMREKREHDEASALYSARQKGIAEGRAEGRAELKNILISHWKKNGYSEEEIQKLLEGF